MKKLILTILAITLIVFVGLAYATDITTTRKVLWEQDAETFAAMDHWELAWGNASGGPYTKITDIGKPATDPIGGVYTLEPISLTVTGQMGKTVTKYFVIRAVMAEGEVSDWSNEATSAFKIAMGVPFNLIINIYTAPE
jgi:hypothetical protein